MLAKKVDTLTKAMEVEAKKMRREVAAMEKEVAAMRVDEHENRARRLGSSKGPVGASQLLPGRYDFYGYFLCCCALLLLLFHESSDLRCYVIMCLRFEFWAHRAASQSPPRPSNFFFFFGDR